MQRESGIAPFKGDVRLDAHMSVVHGHEQVAVLEEGQFNSFASTFSSWIDAQIDAT